MNKFNIKISEGKFSFSSETHKALFNQFLKDNEGKIVNVEKYIPIRSNQQNRFYWVYLGLIEAETGNIADDLHEYFKRVFLPPKFITYKGKEIKIPSSTTELTKAEFGDYMDKISVETGVSIPSEEDIEKLGILVILNQ